ncbi:MAG TPA: 1,4-alpha-glucan branching protein GlgB, partial [Clostridia bacterium]|nr:1,4-alpha-glucan branching protein GlgB [Clostridia bacterium]
TSPINIYELHLASWRRGENGQMLTYDEIADQLIPYIEEMGYTHVELLPVMEHPLDMSWGYQVTGYFAATARHGEPKGLMSLIDRMHQAGIGVILDWVPAHFPRDEIGLRRFDGTPCYEHMDVRRAEMPQWGTMMFDYARGEVCSFLLSNACFWLEYFHADGLRVDAVSSMLYHDFAREDDYLPNHHGGRENLEAIAFMQRLNTIVYRDFPGVMMIAEESSAYPMVTHPVDKGGLGFGFKWNMGWMNDMLSYIKLDPVYRRWHHDKLTFSLFYAFNENFILPFSHDEVVHGKHSMLDKQPGDLWQKFAGLRALYGYTMAHPGKKLLFMGGEFGQFIEWKFDGQLDWFLMVYERHPDLCRCVRVLNHFYREHAAFWQIDGSWDGFLWLTPDDKERSIVVFMRMDLQGEAVICMTNFTSAFYPVFRFGLPGPGTVTECFNTDLKEYGGSNQYNAQPLKAQEELCNGLPWSVQVCVPPLATVYFYYQRKPEPAKTKPGSSGLAQGVKDKEESTDATT